MAAAAAAALRRGTAVADAVHRASPSFRTAPGAGSPPGPQPRSRSAMTDPAALAGAAQNGGDGGGGGGAKTNVDDDDDDDLDDFARASGPRRCRLSPAARYRFFATQVPPPTSLDLPPT
jgi:hypothetical protein